MSNYFYILISFFIIDISFSQEITNVDTDYLKPGISDSMLKNLIFRNGDKINVCKNEEEWNLANEKNKPSVYIYQNEFYYNYNAIKDQRNIFPIGTRLPYAKELDIKYFVNKSGNLIDTYGSIDPNGIVKAEKENVYFWVADKYNGDLEFWNTIRFKKVDTYFGFEKEFSPDLKVSGFVVRPVEDLLESIKTKSYNYKLLMPIETKKTISKVNELFNSTKSRNSSSFILQFEFTKEGENLSKIIDFKTNKLILNNQFNFLNSYLTKIEKPIYLGQNVMAKSTMKVKIENKQIHVNKRKFEYSFEEDVKKLNKLNPNLSELLREAQSKLFVPKVEAFNYNLIIDDSIKNNTEKNYLIGIKSRGILYSAYSIIPGLGILNVDPTRKKTVGMKMIHLSIPIGIVSIGSMMYSSILYKDYRSSSDFSTSKFKQANTYHKVFLTTATAYALLGLIDFTMTFRVGVKNNKFTRRIKNEIKNNYNGGLLLKNPIKKLKN